MGMIGYVRQITPSELDEFRRNPRSVRQLLREETMSGFSPAVRAIIQRMDRSRWRFWEHRKLDAQLREAMEAPGAVDVDQIRASREKGLCLEKCWHELHYLITGEIDEAAPPLGNAILGGTPIGEKLGYGPARYLTPDQVRQVAAALVAISRDELVRRCAAEIPRHQRAYAFGGEDDLDVTLYFFDRLVRYYAEAAECGNAVLLYLR